MSTRSNIGIIKLDGTLEVVYCHFDGYPSHNGEILLHNYTDIKKIEELISKCDIISLEKEIKDCKFFNDRGEETNIIKYNSLKNYLCFAAKDFQIEYFYLFDEKDSKWFMNANRFSAIKVLTEKHIKEY